MSDKKQHINEYSFAALFNELLNDGGSEYRSKGNRKSIKKINMIPKNANVCKIYSDGQHVYAATHFYPGDIVEVCPVKNVSKSALYDHDVRKLVFEVNKDHTYVIPFGYCQYYDLSDEYTCANVDYMWDPNMNTIIIKALNHIEIGDKLILQL